MAGKTDPHAVWPFPTSDEAARPVAVTAGQAASTRDLQFALKFLNAIEAQREVGQLDGETLAGVLDLRHAKGIGSRAAMVNKRLAAMGFKPPEVYKNPRDSTGVRHWMPGPRLGEAIEALLKEEATT
jgi:hypothetical protein